MGTLLVILGVLFLTLLIVVPLIERFAPRSEGRDYSNLTRFIFPLMALLIVIQLIRHFFM